MIENSLLSAYKKHFLLKKRLYDGNYRQKLDTRLNFYDQERMTKQYIETEKAIAVLESIKAELKYAFLKPNSTFFNGEYVGWKDYFLRADQVLYGETSSFEYNNIKNHNETNEKLMQTVVTELNNHFPDEKWTFGEIPLFRWRTLNYSGYEPDEDEIQEWENDPNIIKVYGSYNERFAMPIKCIYQSKIKTALEESQDKLPKLAKVCNQIKKAKRAYIVDRDLLIDNECSGGYDLALKVEYEENLEKFTYGNKLTPQERVMNDTIVKEIEERCSTLPEVALVHNRLDSISKRLDEFVAKNKLEQTTTSKTDKKSDGKKT